jgi:hypothetical protein
VHCDHSVYRAVVPCVSFLHLVSLYSAISVNSVLTCPQIPQHSLDSRVLCSHSHCRTSSLYHSPSSTLIIVVQYAGGVYCMFALILFPAFADRDKIKVSATYADLQPGSSCSDPDTDLFTDCGLCRPPSLTLSWRCSWCGSCAPSSRRSSPHKGAQFQHCCASSLADCYCSLLSKLTTTSIQSGAVTSFLATIVLITFLRETTSNSESASLPVCFFRCIQLTILRSSPSCFQLHAWSCLRSHHALRSYPPACYP